jgi:hypothetical protein
MRWMAVSCVAVIVGCANGPPVSYSPSGADPGDANGGFQYQGDGTDPNEERALEQAESDCASQGKHAVAKRVEGETVYDCKSN